MPPQKQQIDISAGLVPAPSASTTSNSGVDISAGLIPANSQPQSAPQQPRGYFANAWDELGDMAKSAWQIVKPPTSLPELVEKLDPGYIADKMVFEPTIQKAQSAYKAYKEGDPIKGTLGGLAALDPLAPDVTKTYDQAASGDTAGALGRGTVQIGTLLAGSEPVRGALAGKFGGALDSVAPLDKTMNTPRGPSPAEAVTPAEIRQYAAEHNIPMNAAQITEHNLPRNLQSTGERASIGGTAVKQQVKTAQGAISNHIDGLMNDVAPNVSDTASAGDTVQQSVAQALQKQKELAQAKYERVDGLAESGRVKVDFKPLKQAAQDILNDSHYIRERAPSLDLKRASKVVQDVSQFPDRGSFSEAQDLRSRLLDEARHPENAISDEAQGWIKRLSGTTDEQMMKAAQADPDLAQAFRSANAHWEALQQDFNHPRSPLFQVLQEPDPNKIPQKLTTRGQIGGSPYNAQLLDKYGIDKGPIKRMVLQDIYNKNFGVRANTLAGYSDGFLRSLFTPEELKSIYTTGAIARSVGLKANTSGTSDVESAIDDMKSAGKGKFSVPGTKAAAAFATNSPTVNSTLMRRPGSGNLALRFQRGTAPRFSSGALAGAFRNSGQNQQH